MPCHDEPLDACMSCHILVHKSNHGGWHSDDTMTPWPSRLLKLRCKHDHACAWCYEKLWDAVRFCTLCCVLCHADWKPRLPNNKTRVSTRLLGAKTTWQETRVNTRLIDGKAFQNTAGADAKTLTLAYLCDHDTCATKVKASNVCKWSSNEQEWVCGSWVSNNNSRQVDGIICRSMNGHQGHPVALKCLTCNCNHECQAHGQMCVDMLVVLKCKLKLLHV